MTEAQELKRIGAKPHFNSGRGRSQKADGSLDNYIVDIKEYTNSYTISRNGWAKICTDTVKTDAAKEPVICLVLGDERGKTRLGIIAWSELEDLREIRNLYYAGQEHD